MAGRRFDTCFFERYAQHTLETFLGSRYSALVNQDRPDLQMPDKTLGIEVTRAMEPRKDVAQDLLREMAGVESPSDDREEIDQIIKSGYGYGLQDGRYIGRLEYEYWRLAHPLRRIIESKVGKVGSGFYGDRYSKMYLSLIDRLYVCDLSAVDRTEHPTKCTSYDISRKMCKDFFLKALD